MHLLRSTDVRRPVTNFGKIFLNLGIVSTIRVAENVDQFTYLQQEMMD